jgi:hypothetical protein
MAVNDIRVWAECNDGHTTLAGINVDGLTIGELCKWAGVIRSVFTKEAKARDETKD